MRLCKSRPFHPACISVLQRRIQIHHPPRDVAVAARVFIEILLVILLRRIKVSKRFELHGKRLIASRHFLCFLPVIEGLRFFKQALILLIDPGPVLDPLIRALPVIARGVNDLKIVFQQIREADLVFIKIDPDGLRMP